MTNMQTWESQVLDVLQRLAAARIAGLDTRGLLAELEALRATPPKNLGVQGEKNATR